MRQVAERKVGGRRAKLSAAASFVCLFVCPQRLVGALTELPSWLLLQDSETQTCLSPPSSAASFCGQTSLFNHRAGSGSLMDCARAHSAAAAAESQSGPGPIWRSKTDRATRVSDLDDDGGDADDDSDPANEWFWRAMNRLS